MRDGVLHHQRGARKAATGQPVLAPDADGRGPSTGAWATASSTARGSGAEARLLRPTTSAA